MTPTISTQHAMLSQAVTPRHSADPTLCACSSDPFANGPCRLCVDALAAIARKRLAEVTR